VKASDIQEALERGNLFDGAILQHGFAPYMRDYDLVAYFARKSEYLYRFSHCPLIEITTRVTDGVWQRSWGDNFIDYSEWLKSGSPPGYVWGVCESDVYPGAKYIVNSRVAQEWTSRWGKPMHEVVIGTNAYNLHLVFHDLTIKELKKTDPEWVNLPTTSP
jgi:hypothetical protein